MEEYMVLLTVAHAEPCTQNECGFTKKSHVFSQTENAFSVDSMQYIVCNILCRQCAMYCVLLLCYHTARLSSLCKIVCHKTTDLCMKKG